jgi:glycerophosphoryl diester phosphodiesterase
MFSWRDIGTTPIIVAHRGASADAPENTLAAFEEAIRQGADAIELDVRLSRDGEVVVFHDATLGRTTDGRGFVSRKSLSQLKELDAGSWFDETFSGECIPTLAEVLKLVRGRIGINIELKSPGRRRDGRVLARRCADTVKRRDAERCVLFSSFQHSLLKVVTEAMPEATTGVLYDPIRHRGRKPSALARRAGSLYFMCDIRRLRKRIVKDAHAAVLNIAAYSVESREDVDRCCQLGVQALITNRPRHLRKWLK